MAVDHERMTGALQENVLTLLCFDDDACKVIRGAVSAQLFESSVFREVAGAALDFVDQFGEAIKDHLPDVLEHLLNSDDRRKSEVYQKLIKNLFDAREHINSGYVISQLREFVRAQGIKSAIVKAAEAIESGQVNEAEVAMQAGLQSQINVFEKGVSVGDPEQATGFMDNDDEQPLLTGIDYLDEFGVGPAKKTVYLVQALLNRGKSWWLMHLGKWALLQRQCVVHITLEMSEKKTVGRYLQSFFSITKRQAAARVTRFTRDRDGEVNGFNYDEVTRPSLADDGIRAYLKRRVSREFKRRPPLIVKEFATGSLDIAGLEAYLDSLERLHKITPDVLIIDYADLMKLEGDVTHMRQSLGLLFRQLRGLAVRRNLALITAAQSNRAGMDAKVTDERHLSEDFSKGFTVDTNVTYNQTDAEQQLGIARLYVSKHRDDAARMTVLITQAYAMGQFCLDSAKLLGNYWDVIKAGGRTERAND